MIKRITLSLAVVFVLWLSACQHALYANPSSLGAAPYMGWSSWSSQVFTSSSSKASTGEGSDYHTWLTAAHIKAQSVAMHQYLQKHGYQFINLDSGWAGGYDKYGRPIPDHKRFPAGIVGLASFVHSNGQKLGVYLLPGIDSELLKSNPVIYGTKYHLQDIVAQPQQAATGWNTGVKIDYNKPGAQSYINSIANELAGWGVDFLKLDGITPGSDCAENQIDGRQDVVAWQAAIKQTMRPIWLELSWNLNRDFAAFWEAHANGRRITGDIERYGATYTDWYAVALRFGASASWSGEAGNGKGWNDLDSLDICNGSTDGLTDIERQTCVTLWAISCSPLYVGGDLTNIDPVGLSLLTNDEVISVDQAGRPGKCLQAGTAQVWRVENADGSETVALFNLDDKNSTSVAVHLSDLGIRGTVKIRDLWSHTNLGVFKSSYARNLAPHESCLLRISLTR